VLALTPLTPVFTESNYPRAGEGTWSEDRHTETAIAGRLCFGVGEHDAKSVGIAPWSSSSFQRSWVGSQLLVRF
jgi:hypothetical protein